MSDLSADWTFDTADAAGTGTSGSYSLSDGSIARFQDTKNVICFAAGTHLMTPDGPRAVETLKPGDLVCTMDDGPQPVRWIGQSLVAGVGDLAPIEIRPGDRFDVERPLLVSPQHRMLVEGAEAELVFGEDEVLVPARDLIDGVHVRRVERPLMTYVHVMFDRHQVIFAEGAPTESFHPDDEGLCALGPAARAALWRAFPALEHDPSSYGPTARRCALPHETLVMLAA